MLHDVVLAEDWSLPKINYVALAPKSSCAVVAPLRRNRGYVQSAQQRRLSLPHPTTRGMRVGRDAGGVRIAG